MVYLSKSPRYQTSCSFANNVPSKRRLEEVEFNPISINKHRHHKIQTNSSGL